MRGSVREWVRRENAFFPPRPGRGSGRSREGATGASFLFLAFPAAAAVCGDHPAGRACVWPASRSRASSFEGRGRAASPTQGERESPRGERPEEQAKARASSPSPFRERSERERGITSEKGEKVERVSSARAASRAAFSGHEQVQGEREALNLLSV